MEINQKKVIRNFLENYLETKSRIEFRNSQIKALSQEINILPYENFSQKLNDMPKAKNKKTSSKQEVYSIKKEEIQSKIKMYEYNNSIDEIIITYIDTKYDCLKSDLKFIIKYKFFEKARNDRDIISNYQKKYGYISEKSFYRKLNIALDNMSFSEDEFLQLSHFTKMD